MRVHFGLPADKLGATSLAIGSFDGVHVGHRELIRRLTSGSAGSIPALITFEPHPRCVLDPANCPQSITTLDEKLALIEHLGVAEAIVLAFTRELAQLSAEDFVGQVNESLELRRLVAGPDFALGRQRQGNIEWLRDCGRRRGFEVEVVDAVSQDGREVHSSEIRRLVTLGDLEQANLLLGRDYMVAGIVEAGERIGRRLGYPTINVRTEPNKLVPGHGIYAGRVRTEAGDHLAAISVGYRPQFGGTTLKLEAYLLDFSGDLYQQQVAVRFAHRLRDEARFADEAALVEQMRLDIQETRRRLGS